MRTLSKSAFVYLIMILVLTGSCKQSKVNKKRQPTEAVASEQPNAVNTKTRQAEGLTQNLPTTQGELPKAEKGTTPNETTNQDGSPDHVAMETTVPESVSANSQQTEPSYGEGNAIPKSPSPSYAQPVPQQYNARAEPLSQEQNERICRLYCDKLQAIKAAIESEQQEVLSLSTVDNLLGQLKPHLSDGTGEKQKSLHDLYNEVKNMRPYDIKQKLENLNKALQRLQANDGIQKKSFKEAQEVISYTQAYMQNPELVMDYITKMKAIKRKVNHEIKKTTPKKQRPQRS